jgi:hypothetical protein
VLARRRDDVAAAAADVEAGAELAGGVAEPRRAGGEVQVLAAGAAGAPRRRQRLVLALQARASERRPVGPSTSITSSAPVAMPTLASGQRAHQARNCDRRVEASLSPRRVRGCLPGFAQSARRHEQPCASGVCSGSTGQPRAA